MPKLPKMMRATGKARRMCSWDVEIAAVRTPLQRQDTCRSVIEYPYWLQSDEKLRPTMKIRHQGAAVRDRVHGTRVHENPVHVDAGGVGQLLRGG